MLRNHGVLYDVNALLAAGPGNETPAFVPGQRGVLHPLWSTVFLLRGEEMPRHVDHRIHQGAGADAPKGVAGVLRTVRDGSDGGAFLCSVQGLGAAHGASHGAAHGASIFDA